MGRFVDQFFTQITGPKTSFADTTLDSGGEAPPALVFLHGVMGYALNWRRVAKHFEDRYMVLAYDSRGHGRSIHADLEKTPEAFTPEALAEDLRGILDDLSAENPAWKKVFLVGHSMGGRVAYTFAAKYPERVRALVIEDIGPDMSETSASTSSRVLDTVPVPFANKREAKAWFETEFPVRFADLHNAQALGAWLYANITEDEGGRAVWRFQAEGVRAAVVAGRTVERWDAIERLRVPTLLVRGELSKDLPRSVYEKMQQMNPVIEGVELSGVGHWVHSEKFDEFVQVVELFLDRARQQSENR